MIEILCSDFKYYFLVLLLVLPAFSDTYSQDGEELFLSDELSGIIEVAIDKEGNFIILEDKGIAVTPSFGGIRLEVIHKNIFLSKYDPSFNLLWEQPFAIERSYGLVLQLTDDDEIQVAAYDDQFSIFTYDKDGTLINQDSFSNLIETPVPGNRFRDFIQNENETIIAGTFRDTLFVNDKKYPTHNTNITESFVASYNNDNEINWIFKFYENFSGVQDIYQYKNGDILLTGNGNYWARFEGEEASFNLTGWNYFTYLIMLDKDGKIIWTKNINNSESLTTSLSKNITVDKTEKYFYLSGQINLSASISKYDRAGNLVWEKSAVRDEDVFSNSFYNDMVLSETGNIYLCGKMFGKFSLGGNAYSSTDLQRFDQLVVNYDVSGNFKSIAINEGSKDDEWKCLAEFQEELIVGGFKDGVYGSQGTPFENYSHLMRFDFSTESSDEFYNQLIVAYPNPSPGGAFCIRFQDDFWGELKADPAGQLVVKLYDSVGRLIHQIPMTDDLLLTNPVLFNPDLYLPDGCYVLVVESGDRREVVKFVVTNLE